MFKRFFQRGGAYSLEALSLVMHTLNFNYGEIMELEIDEFNEFVKISIEILKAEYGAKS